MLNKYAVKIASEFAMLFETIPFRSSTQFQIICVFKTFHSGERIQKVADLHTGFAGYVWTEGESAKKKLQIKNISGYVWTGP